MLASALLLSWIPGALALDAVLPGAGALWLVVAPFAAVAAS